MLLGDAFGTSFTSLRDLTDDGYTTIDGVEYENIEVKSDGTIGGNFSCGSGRFSYFTGQESDGGRQTIRLSTCLRW